MSRTAKRRRSGNHKAVLTKRRAEQRARTPFDFAAMRGRINLKRAAAQLPPLKDPVDRYPGAALRRIRAQATNWRGEARR